MSNDAPTPANDLAAKIAEQINSVNRARGHVLTSGRYGSADVMETAEMTRIIRENLAPTLDALAAAEQRATVSDSIRHAEKQILIKEISAHTATKARLSRNEADCAALRTALQSARDQFVAFGWSVVDLDAALATNAGKPLLDELARANKNAEVMAKVADNATAHAKKLQADLTAAESALRLAKEDGERLDWLSDRLVRVSEAMATKQPIVVNYVPSGYGLDDDAASLRICIDAARQKLPEEPKP